MRVNSLTDYNVVTLHIPEGNRGFTVIVISGLKNHLMAIFLKLSEGHLYPVVHTA